MKTKTPNYRAEATRIARKHGIPPAIFHALIGAESGWDQSRVSPVGAIGRTQLMPGTARGLGVDPRDPIQNLEGGARYLRQQLDRFGGDLRLALAAYNAGPNAVAEYGGIPPFKETQRYVSKIMSQVSKTTATASTATPPAGVETAASFLTPPPDAPDLGSVAFEGLGRIARGEAKPTETLGELASAAVAQQAEVPSVGPAAPAPSASTATPRRPSLTPGGGWGGSYGIAKSFADIGVGAGLTAISEKRDRKHTTTGGVSDHFSGNKSAYAYDLSNGDRPTPEMDRAAQQIAAQLGVKWTPAKGELNITKVVNGYRVQVLYRTNKGGNHYNHIHVGVRKVGR